jgi:hypothetical protein
LKAFTTLSLDFASTVMFQDISWSTASGTFCGTRHEVPVEQVAYVHFCGSVVEVTTE